MRWVRVLAVGVALTALASAVVLGRAPGVLEQVVDLTAVERAVSNRAGTATVGAGAIALAVLGLGRAVNASAGEPEPLGDPATTDAVADGGDALASDRPIDEALQGALDAPRSVDRDRNRDRIRKRLASVAADRIATIEACSDDAARRRVNDGSWTADPVVAAFLGDERAPDAPLRWRLYEWLYEDRALESAVDRAIAEIETYDRRDGRGETDPMDDRDESESMGDRGDDR